MQEGGTAIHSITRKIPRQATSLSSGENTNTVSAVLEPYISPSGCHSKMHLLPVERWDAVPVSSDDQAGNGEESSVGLRGDKRLPCMDVGAHLRVPGDLFDAACATRLSSSTISRQRS